MRRYVFYYWVEVNDSPDDREHMVEADNIDEALINFKKQIKIFKRITGIHEISQI
jgi:hypothetical protein